MRSTLVITCLFLASCTIYGTGISSSSRKMPLFNQNIIAANKSVENSASASNISNLSDGKKTSLALANFSIADRPRQNILARSLGSIENISQNSGNLLVNGSSQKVNFASANDGGEFSDVQQNIDAVRSEAKSDIVKFMHAQEGKQKIRGNVVEIGTFASIDVAKKVALVSQRRINLPFKVLPMNGKFVVQSAGALPREKAYQVANLALNLGYYDAIVR